VAIVFDVVGAEVVLKDVVGHIVAIVNTNNLLGVTENCRNDSFDSK
jgi:hypothetical protein